MLDLRPNHYDIIIVGGGLSGLTAGYKLLNDPKMTFKPKVLILEADQRLGGRILSVPLPAGAGFSPNARLDVGGQWFKPENVHSMNLIEELGLQTYQHFVLGKRMLKKGSKVKSFMGTPYEAMVSGMAAFQLRRLLNKLKTMVANISPLAPMDYKDSASLDKVSVASWAKHHAWSTRGAEALAMAVETTFGCNPKDVSMLFFLHFIAASEKGLLGAHPKTIDLGIVGGCHKLVDELANRFVALGGTIRTGAHVQSIIQEASPSPTSGTGTGVGTGMGMGTTSTTTTTTTTTTIPTPSAGLSSSSSSDPNYCICTDTCSTTSSDLKELFTSVTVRTLNNETYNASYLIFAAPPTALKSIQFSPPLAPEKELLGRASMMGSYIKAFAVYSTPFWRSNQQSGDAFVPTTHTQLDAVSFTEDASDPGTGVYALAVYITGARANFWAQKTVADRKAGVLSSLVEFFGAQAAQPLYYVESNWSENPYSGGGPFATLPPGVLQATFGLLRLPIYRIHWAGCETSTEYFGSMEGAISAGVQASFEVSNRFNATRMLEQRRTVLELGIRPEAGGSAIPTFVGSQTGACPEVKAVVAPPSPLNMPKNAGTTEQPAPSVLAKPVAASQR